MPAAARNNDDRGPIPMVRPAPLRAILAAPDASIDEVRRIEASPFGLEIPAVVADAALLDAAALKVDARVAFIWRRLANWQPGMVDLLARRGVACVLLVEEEHRRTPDLLSPDTGAFAPGVLAEAARGGFPSVAAWPGGPAPLGLARDRAGGALERARVGSARAGLLSARGGRLLVFCSGLAGVGTTETALNVAAVLAEAGKVVSLVDLDLGEASLRDKLRLPTLPSQTGLHRLAEDAGLGPTPLADAGGDDGPIDPAPYALVYGGEGGGSVRSSGARGDARGRVDAFLGIEDRALFPAFGSDVALAGRVVAGLRAAYDVVVVDLGTTRTPGPVRLAVAGWADALVVVTTPDPSESGRIAADYDALRASLELPEERYHVLVNRLGDPAYDEGLVEIAARFGKAALSLAVVEDQPLVRAARRRGYPPPALATDGLARTSAFREDIENVATALVPGVTFAPRRPARTWEGVAARGAHVARALSDRWDARRGRRRGE